MADTYTEGYRKGFAATGRSYEGKKTVQIRYHIGFERMIRMAVENFRELGLEPIIARASIGTVNRMAARHERLLWHTGRTASTSMITATTMRFTWTRPFVSGNCLF